MALKKAKVAVIAGAGEGLGASLCRLLAEKGYNVAAVSRSTKVADQLQKELERSKGSLVHFPCDVTDRSQVIAAFGKIRDTLGMPRVLIYNPGAFSMGGFLQTEPHEFERCWRINCLGAVHWCRSVIPGMIDAGGGAIIVSGATAAVKGSANFSAFSQSKFALRALCQSLAREFGPKGIHVAHVIIDGVIFMERTARGFGATKKTALDPDAIAQTYLHLIEQDRSAWTQEVDLRPDIEKF